MVTFRLTVEYEGTRYRGWQEQKNARSVAGELRAAIEKVVGGPVELGGSGRTDAGVHALAQVAHLRTARDLAPERLLVATNDSLPVDIHVLDVARADPRFHARHHATSRSYLYQISRRRTALGKRFVWWVRPPVDLESLRDAAAAIEGRHDFAAFAERRDEGESTDVVVERVEVAAEGDLVLVRIVASHFLWKMVRRVVGTLVAVATGELERAAVDELLARRNAGEFRPAEHTAPPSGLFLERVLYPGDRPLGPLRAAVRVDPPPVSDARPSAPTPGARRRAARRPR